MNSIKCYGCTFVFRIYSPVTYTEWSLSILKEEFKEWFLMCFKIKRKTSYKHRSKCLISQTYKMLKLKKKMIFLKISTTTQIILMKLCIYFKDMNLCVCACVCERERERGRMLFFYLIRMSPRINRCAPDLWN